jgi:hypothetical protein
MPEDPFFPDQFVPWREVAAAEVSKFESSLNAARNEADLQRFLEENPLILMLQTGGGLGAWVIPQARLGAEHVTDFLVAKEASVGYMWYAVELERPQAKMFNKNGDVSKDLNHALRQIGDWRDWLTNNLDYARRSRNKSGHNLTDIDPELQGLIIIGRDVDIDRSTDERRRRLIREHRTRIETYDWLLSRARENSTSSPKIIARSNQDLLGALIDHAVANPRPERSAEKAVREAFGGTWHSSTSVSATRDIDWESVELGPDYPDVLAPIEIVYASGRELEGFLQPRDWDDWIDNVVRALVEHRSILITEKEPAARLQETLTKAREGIWYVTHGLHMYSGIDVLVYLPPDIGYEEKVSRVAVAREALLRSIPDLARERDLEREQEREADSRIASLSLAPGDAVTHDKFGRGTVVSVSGSGAHIEAMIEFGEEYGVKLLVLRYAPLKKIRGGST